MRQVLYIIRSGLIPFVLFFISTFFRQAWRCDGESDAKKNRYPKHPPDSGPTI